MNRLERDPGGSWANRIATLLVDAAFAACAHLPRTDRELLLREIAKRALWHLSNCAVELRKPAKDLGREIPDHPSKVRSPNKSPYSHVPDRLETNRAA
jgi:hypothetical protein